MTHTRQYEIYIDRVRKNYKIITLEDHNQEYKEKK